MLININWTLKNENVNSTIDELVLKLIGFYLVINLFLCIILNSILLLVFIRFKKTRTPLNQLIIIMTIFNLVGSLQFPFVIHSHISYKWIWSKLGCIFCGLLIYFIGCLQIYLMVSISYVRFRILKDENFKSVNKRKKLVLVPTIISFLLSLFWSFAPLFGWSYYSLEDSLVSCSVEYNEKTFNVVSYNIGMFTSVFIIPFSMIIIFNLKTILYLKEIQRGVLSFESDKLVCAEKKVTISMIIYISGFLVTWMPYTLISLYNAFIKEANYSLSTATSLAAVIAKSSVVWSTLLYMFTNKSIYSKLNRNLFKMQKF